MARMITSTVAFHWATRVSAHHGTKGTLQITVYGDPCASDEQFNMGEVTIFTEDPDLVDRLVAAINGAAR